MVLLHRIFTDSLAKEYALQISLDRFRSLQIPLDPFRPLQTPLDPFRPLQIPLEQFRKVQNNLEQYRKNQKSIEQYKKILPNGKNLGIKITYLEQNKPKGLPDAFVLPNLDNEFSEYQFTVDNLEEFIGYRIKIVMSGTNEAFPPRFKDFRAIALA